jgi:hypothetical protein
MKYLPAALSIDAERNFVFVASHTDSFHSLNTSNWTFRPLRGVE